MRIIHEEAELVSFFHFGYLSQLALVAGHSKNAFGNHQDAPGILLVDQGGGTLELLVQVLHIIVLEHITVAGVQPYAVNDTGMAFPIVNDHIMTAAERIYYRYHTLVAIVQQAGVFLSFKFSQLFFQLFMIIAVPAHHAGAHRVGQSILFGRIGIGFTYFGVIGKAQVIVQAPNDYFLSAEIHPAADFSFQLGEGKITMRSFTVLAYRAIVFHKTFKKICHN